jgi:hypothetical protein
LCNACRARNTTDTCDDHLQACTMCEASGLNLFQWEGHVRSQAFNRSASHQTGLGDRAQACRQCATSSTTPFPLHSSVYNQPANSNKHSRIHSFL